MKLINILSGIIIYVEQYENLINNETVMLQYAPANINFRMSSQLFAINGDYI